MKKNVFQIFVIVSIFFSCNKEESNATCTLINEMRYHQYLGDTIREETIITYNANGQVAQIEIIHDEIYCHYFSDCNDFDYNQLYSFNYVNDRLEAVIMNQSGTSGEFYDSSRYIYDGELIREILRRRDLTVEENYFFTYSNGKLSEMNYWFRTHPSQEFEHWSRQLYYWQGENISEVESGRVGIENMYNHKIKYDDKNNPYNNLIPYGHLDMPKFLSRNNILETRISNQGELVGLNSNQYQYSSDGYPTDIAEGNEFYTNILSYDCKN